MNESIKVSAPGKLMLFGEHAVIYGNPCIVTAVDQRMEVEVRIQSKKGLLIDARDVGVADYFVNFNRLGKGKRTLKGAKFIEYAVKNFVKEYDNCPGIHIKTKSDFSSKFGFGSSSAVTVGVIKALSLLLGKKLSKKKLFSLSYKTVLDVQGVGSGFDLAAAIWGGTLYFVTGGKQITSLKKGNLPIVVGYTGIKAETSLLVKQVAGLRKRRKRLVDSTFNLITEVVREARKDISNSNYTGLGELMNINQGYLETLGVNTIELSNLIFAAKSAGAYGAKLSGAGGGDCMVALASGSKMDDVKKAIKKNGGKVIDVKMGAEGVRVEK